MEFTTKASSVVGVAVLMGFAFAAGSWVTWSKVGHGSSPGAVKPLYYVDPMHPSYRSDKPGTAPDCGMALEPVFADAAGQTPIAGGIKAPDGTRQLIGVETGLVESKTLSATIRALGRVAADEARVYRLLAPSAGVVKQDERVTSGSLVRKDELLAVFFSADYDLQGRYRPLAAAQLYFNELDALDRVTKANAPPEQIAASKAAIQRAIDSLLNTGMGEYQIAQIAKTRQSTANLEVRSPVNGYVMSRGVADHLPVDRGAEFFKIADISRVWILLDLPEREPAGLAPGSHVRVSLPAPATGVFEAVVGRALPQFDPDSRTTKVRLEVDNRDGRLRPGMFVDAEIPVALGTGIAVPAAAVVDSGMRRTVFVDRGNGYFEPRRVQTGWRLDDRVQITRGLTAGERIALSGTFLLDSETRMKSAAAGMASTVTDPVCGMAIDEMKAKDARRMVVHRGETYFFCSEDCRKKFEADPSQHVMMP